MMDETVREERPKALDRYLRPHDVWAMAFGCAVGWGAFVMPGTTFLPVAGPAGTICALVFGMLFMLVIGACLNFLMRGTTRTGGIYSHTKEAFGRDHAFLCSWFLCLSYLTIVFLNGSALFVVIRTLVGSGALEGPSYQVGASQVSVAEVAFSVGALVVVGLLFVFAKPWLQRLQTAFAFLLAAGALFVGIVCLPHVDLSSLTQAGTLGVPAAFGTLSITILAPWAYVGFETASFETAHYTFDARRMRRITPLAIASAAAAYVLMTLASISARPEGMASWQDYVAGLGGESGLASVPTFFAAERIAGTVGLVAVALAALAAIMTGIIGGYRATVRVLSTMAEDKILGERFRRTSSSIVFIMVISVAISFLGRNTLVWFVDLTSFGAVVAYAYLCAAAHRAARIEGNAKIRAISFVGLSISVVFAVVQVSPGLVAFETMCAEAYLLLALWCLLGFVFLWRTIQRSEMAEYGGLSISGTAIFALLVYASIMWLLKLAGQENSIEGVHAIMRWGGVLVIFLVLVGLTVMLYVQNLVRRKHEASEREKIRAVEGSLAKSQFLFNMSHDIRTPMNAIVGYTNLALAEPDIDVVHDHLTKIASSSAHLLDLINDILEMSRIESGALSVNYEPLDILSTLGDIHDLFAEQMRERGIDYAVHAGQVRDHFVWADGKALRRVLINLVGNAYKFTEAGGSVTVSLREERGVEDGYATYFLSCKDTGIGMSAEFVERMFNAFERERTSTDSGKEGTGLGLAITKGIIDLMGGTIEVLTSPGSGTQVICRLRLRVCTAEEVTELLASEEPQVGQTEVSHEGRRLLVVEDNDINLEIARMILEGEGFVVEAAENGQVAVDMVSSAEAGYYDAVLMDIQMPVMDGYGATRAIRALPDKAKAKVPILAMTANAFKEDEEAALAAGMVAHIAKPVDIDDLLGKLDAALSAAEEG